MSYSIVVTTCPTKDEAETLAAKIVENRLAACVQISVIQSIYYWENSTQNETEYKLQIKTRKTLYHNLETFILENHSYEVPQIIEVPIENGYLTYLDWIKENTKD